MNFRFWKFKKILCVGDSKNCNLQKLFLFLQIMVTSVWDESQIPFNNNSAPCLRQADERSEVVKSSRAKLTPGRAGAAGCCQGQGTESLKHINRFWENGAPLIYEISLPILVI